MSVKPADSFPHSIDPIGEGEEPVDLVKDIRQYLYRISAAGSCDLQYHYDYHGSSSYVTEDQSQSIYHNYKYHTGHRRGEPHEPGMDRAAVEEENISRNNDGGLNLTYQEEDKISAEESFCFIDPWIFFTVCGTVHQRPRR